MEVCSVRTHESFILLIMFVAYRNIVVINDLVFNVSYWPDGKDEGTKN